MKHARYYWLMLAESHLTRRLFGGVVRRIAALPTLAEWAKAAVAGKSINEQVGGGKVWAQSGKRAAVAGHRVLGRNRASLSGAPRRTRTHNLNPKDLRQRQAGVQFLRSQESKTEILDDNAAAVS